MDNYHHLWDVVQNGVVPGAGALEPATLQLELEQYRSKLLNLFRNKGPDGALRQQVQKGSVQTPNFGEVPLDYDPDQIRVVELSDKLRLDEITCVELLVYAQDKFGLGSTTEAPFGVYLNERFSGARALCRLLALQLYHQLEPRLDLEADVNMEGLSPEDVMRAHLSELIEQQPLLAVVVKFNDSLLRDQANGKNTLISRLVEVIKDHTVDSLGPAFTYALDQYGGQVLRGWFTAQERTELCRALLYAVMLSPVPLLAATLAEMLQLLESLVTKVKASGASAPHTLLQQATNVLMAVVAALGLQNAAGGHDTPPAAMAQLLRSQELQTQLQKMSKPEDGFAAVVTLAWGLTKDALVSSTGGSAQQVPGLGNSNFDGSTPGPATTALLEGAGKGRALGTLAGLLSSVAFDLEAEESHKHLCARIVYGLLTDTLRFDAANRRELTESLHKASKQHMDKQVSSSKGGTWYPAISPSDLLAVAAAQAPAAPVADQLALIPSGTAGAAVPGLQAGQYQGLAWQDDLSSLLEALASVFRVRPGLWHSREATTAYPYVSGFMSYVAVHGTVQLPDVRVSFLSVMTALAAGPQGSRFILVQFRQNASKPELESFTWRRLFRSIVAYCQRYEELERNAIAAGAGGMMGPTGLLAARDDALMAPGDAVLLVAYLDLLTKVISEGTLDEVRSSLQALDRDLAAVLGGLPLYEPLFQLMCHGVPSKVKAAVHRCLAALGRFSELAPRLLERLIMAAVVSAPAAAMEGYAGLSRFDLLLQINEVEARQEDYSETLAFLDLVNALMVTLGPTGLPAGAAAVAHYTQLVLQHVVQHLWQRGYKDPCQKWQLAAACFKHCQLVLAALATWPPNITGQELVNHPPPGLAVLLSLMGGRQLEKALLQHVLGPGQEELAVTLEFGPEGPHRAAAVLEGFKLLNMALEYDQGAAEQVNSTNVRDRVVPLQHQLISPPRRLAVLLQYINNDSMALQYEVIRLVSQLAARLPDIVGLLQPNFDNSAAIYIRQGFAQSFELALLDPSAGESVSAGMAAAREAEASGQAVPSSPADQRAELLLDVMLGTLDTMHPPTLGHLLLGFDTTVPPQEWSRIALDPHIEFTCLTVLLRSLQAPVLQQVKPALYAKCLQLLYTITESPLTCEPVCRLLHPSEAASGELLTALGGILLEPLPAGSSHGFAAQNGVEAGVHEQVAALRQRAYVLRLYALIMLRCEQPSMLEPVLAALLGPAPTAAAAAASGFANGTAPRLNPYASTSGSVGLLALQQMCGLALSEPRMDVSPELQQLQQDMMVNDVSVAMLLSQPAVMEELHVVTTDDYGQPLFDFGVLQRLLHERFEDYVAKSGARGGPTEKLARDAVVAAFQHAQRFNAHALLAGAQLQAAVAWVQAINIGFTKAYALLNKSTAQGCGPELLHSYLRGVLQQVKELMARQSSGLAEKLAGCCRVLLCKLQELASLSLSLGLPGDPLSQVRLPVRCEALLHLLLDCLKAASSHRGLRAESHRGLRAEMYVCLLQYLHFCRGSKLGDCTPLVLSCLLSGAGPGTSAAQLDALQTQLEEVNGRLLRPLASDLVGLMTVDVLQPPDRGGTAQAVALHLLSALIAADPSSTAVADALYRANVPKSLLESVVNYAPNILLQPAHKSQAALQVLEAQLSLLLSLTSAGGPAAIRGSIKAVADAGTLPYLTACRALDYTPEQPSSHQRLKKSGSLRYRLMHVVCPSLRLVLALLAGAPGRSKLVQEAVGFTAAHQDLLARLMQEAAAPATPAWAPGDEELEQAALAVSLLARLPGVLLPSDVVSAAGGAAGGAAGAGSLQGLRRDVFRLWLVLAGHDNRESSIVAQLHAAPMLDGALAAGGAARLKQEQRRGQLLQLRCGLASCLRNVVTPVAAASSRRVGPAAVAGGAVVPRGSELLLKCVGHEAQKTVDELGRPTLLLVHDTADQACSDTTTLAEDLAGLLTFLSTPDSLTSNATVAQKLAEWGPALAGLTASSSSSSHHDHHQGPGHMGSTTAATPARSPGPAGAGSMALVLAADGAAPGSGSHSRALTAAATAAAGGFGGLDPAAARRLARQSAARGAGVLLGQLMKQLNLVEQCLAIVLLHFVQCLPRPDTATALSAGSRDGMLLDASAAAADGSMSDPLLQNPPPEAAAILGDAGQLQFFATKMRQLGDQAASMASRVRDVVRGGAAADGGDGAVGMNGAAVGAEQLLESLDSVELLNRQLQAYLATI